MEVPDLFLQWKSKGGGGGGGGGEEKEGGWGKDLTPHSTFKTLERNTILRFSAIDAHRKKCSSKKSPSPHPPILLSENVSSFSPFIPTF